MIHELKGHPRAKPAVFPGGNTMPYEEYQDIKALNWSTLKYMSISARMYRFRLAHPERRKKVWVLGDAIHCGILQPAVFDARYITPDAETIKALAPGRGTTEGKALIKEHPEWSTALMTSDEYQAACVAAAFPGREVLTEAQRAICVAAGESVREHRETRDLLRGGLAEETVTWTDPNTGLACKGRLDYLRPDVAIDLKSTRDPSQAKFERDATNYGYAAQAAFYHDGAVAAGRLSGGDLPWIIAVRSCDDFDVAPYQLTQDAYDTGRAIYRSLLQRLAECIAADYWPGVAPERRALNLSPWAASQVITDPPSEEM